ncbi:MAG: hypothetical protein N4A61_00190 [Pelagimonas sp.]|jgi:hemolysin activation/secretion protein|nr:hypothetical protein [Pelagimonas sp.]
MLIQKFRATVALPLVIFAGALAAQDIDLDAADAVDTQQPASETSTAVPAEAQAAAQATQQPQPQTATAQPAQPKPRQPKRRVIPGFVLRDIVFANGSELLSHDTLQQAEAGLVGRRYLHRQLGDLVAALSGLYGQQGHEHSRFVAESMDYTRGVLTVRHYEPRLGPVTGGNKVVSQNYLRYRLQIPEGALADTTPYQQSVERLAVTDGLALALTPEDQGNGIVTLNAQVPDIKRHLTTLSFDNYGSAAQGQQQATLTHRINGLSGWNDPLILSYVRREGQDSVSLSYSRVIHPDGARASVSWTGSQSKSVTTPSIKGKVRSASLGLNIPVIARPTRQLSVNLALRDYHETSDLVGVRTLDHRGRELTLGANGFTRGDNWTLSGGLGITRGTFDNAVTGVSKSTYTATNANLSYALSLGQAAFVSAAVQAQKNLDGLQSSQGTFTVTSPFAVRGYPTSLSVGDSGYAVRVQLEKSANIALGPSFAIRPFAFADGGKAFDSTDTPLGLARSVGAGFSFGLAGSVFGDVFVAKPLDTNIIGWTDPNTDPILRGSMSVQF